MISTSINEHFYYCLYTGSRPPELEFSKDGSKKNVELKIVNLQSEGRDGEGRKWEEIGVWQSWGKEETEDKGSEKEGKVLILHS